MFPPLGCVLAHVATYGMVAQHVGQPSQARLGDVRMWSRTAIAVAAVALLTASITAARAYNLSLTTRGTTISAQINGILVAAVTNRMYRYGPAGLGSLGYYPVLYPSFTVR